MSIMFPSFSIESSPAAARPVMAAVRDRFGFVPSPVAKAAGSPPLLAHLLAGFAAFDESSLSHTEREVLAMTVAYEVGCHYCMAMHSALGARAPEVAPHVAALRAGADLADARLEALRALARDLVRTRAHPPAETWARFVAAGYTEQNALDVVLGVGVYLLSTYANVVTRAEVDPPFAAFAWVDARAERRHEAGAGNG